MLNKIIFLSTVSVALAAPQVYLAYANVPRQFAYAQPLVVEAPATVPAPVVDPLAVPTAPPLTPQQIVEAQIVADRLKNDPQIISVNNKFSCTLRTLAESACQLASSIECDSESLNEIAQIYADSKPETPGVSSPVIIPPGALKLDPNGKAKAGEILCGGTTNFAKYSCDLAAAIPPC